MTRIRSGHIWGAVPATLLGLCVTLNTAISTIKYKTGSDLDNQICPVHKAISTTTGRCPTTTWVTVSETTGSYGSWLEAYATLWLWNQENRFEHEALTPLCLVLNLAPLCERLSLPVLWSMKCGVEKPVFVVPRNRMDVAAVARHLQDLRHELRLLPNLRVVAQRILQNEEGQMGPGVASGKGQVWWVGLHACFTDELSEKVTVPSVSWFVRAAEVSLNKAPALAPRALLVLSDGDASWVRNELLPALYSALKGSTYIAYLQQNVTCSMALLAAMNASVINHGTFSTFSALLAGGHTIAHPQAKYAVDLAKYLTHWTIQY